MPEITKKLQINLNDLEKVFSLAKESLLELGAGEISESNTNQIKAIEGIVPSIWGWGGMKIGLLVQKTETGIEINMTGYIAQLAVSPLTKNMDKLTDLIGTKLKTNCNYELDYEKMTKFVPSYKSKITNTDKTLFTTILIVTFISTFGGMIFKSESALITALVLGGGYYFGRKYLYKDKN